ncbi:MAG: prolyl oligopeptidase family serine peptidase [Tepidisphaerales bacterium]
MALRFKCTACGQLYRVPDSMGGRTIHCFSCGQAVVAGTQHRVADDAPVDQSAGEMVIMSPPPKARQRATPLSHKTAPEDEILDISMFEVVEYDDRGSLPMSPSTGAIPLAPEPARRPPPRKPAARKEEPISLEAQGLEIVEDEDAPLPVVADDGPLPVATDDGPLRIVTDDEPPTAPRESKRPLPPPQSHSAARTPAAAPAKPKLYVPVSRTSGKAAPKPAPAGYTAAPGKHVASPARPAAAGAHGMQRPARAPRQPVADDDDLLSLDNLASAAASEATAPEVPLAAPTQAAGAASAVASQLGAVAGVAGRGLSLGAGALLSLVPKLWPLLLLAVPVVLWLTVPRVVIQGAAACLLIGIVLALLCFIVILLKIPSLWPGGWPGYIGTILALNLLACFLAQVHPMLPVALNVMWIAVWLLFVISNLGEIFQICRAWLVTGFSALLVAIISGGILMYGPGHMPTGSLFGGSAGSNPARAVVVSSTPPSFSPRGPEMLAASTSAGSGATGQDVRVWIYLPTAQAGRPRSVGCVFIAPAGSTCFTGMNLSSDDELEFVPYVRAGFAVVAYDLEGPLRDTDSPSRSEVTTAVKAFMAADGGLADARMAIEYTLKTVPEVDPSRLYAAGHSSAGTVALLLAASDARIKGCIAYAPCSDLEGRLREASDLGRLVSGTADFARSHSPLTVAERLACPVFLFHANDDDNVPVSQSHTLRSRSPKIQIMTVSSGGHRDAYIQEGIPAGIAWLRSRDTELGGARTGDTAIAQRTPGPTNPGRANIFDNPPPRTHVPFTPSPRPMVTERPVPGSTEPSPATPLQPVSPRPATPAVTERPVPGVTPTPSGTSPAAERPLPGTNPPVSPAPKDLVVVKPMPAPVTPPARPPVVVDTTPASQLSKLGADVKTDADHEIVSVDVRGAGDVAAAAKILAGFKRVPVLRVLPSQFTPDAMLALKTIPSITRLEFSDVKIADADLARIAGLSNVDELSLNSQPITSAGIRNLSAMWTLKKLYLKATKIDDGACQYLARMTSLRYLDVTDTHLTSDGIVQLKPLKSLVGLVLTHTDVSDAAQETLKAALPRLNIIPP